MRLDRTNSILNANILFLALAIVFIFVGGIVQQRNIYTGVLITEYVLILLPNLLYLKFMNKPLKESLSLRIVSPKQILFTFLSVVTAYPIAVFLNFLMMLLVNSVSDVVPTGVPIPSSWTEYIIGIFVIAITPGICEEVMFRGTLLSAYRELGDKKALLLTSFLFGIFHFNLLNFAGPAFLGLVLGIIFLKTKSLFAAMFGHVLNNSLALSLGFFMTRLLEKHSDIATETPQLTDGTEIIFVIIALAGWGFISSILLFLILKYFPKTADKIEEDMLDGENEESPVDYEFGEYQPRVNQQLRWIPVIATIGIFIFLNYRYFMT